MIIVKVVLFPDGSQEDRLHQTILQFNKACNLISEVAFSSQTTNKRYIQDLVYARCINEFNLSSQMVIRAISKVVSALKNEGLSRQLFFKEQGVVFFDKRNARFSDIDLVNIKLIGGREIIPVKILSYCIINNDKTRVDGQMDLLIDENKFMLYANSNIQFPENESCQLGVFMGCDLGLI